MEKKNRVVAGIFPAVKLLPWWAVSVIWRFTAIFVNRHILVLLPTAKVLPPKNEKPPTAKTFIYRRKNTAIFWF